jgi:hypothetical protein
MCLRLASRDGVIWRDAVLRLPWRFPIHNHARQLDFPT